MDRRWRRVSFLVRTRIDCFTRMKSYYSTSMDSAWISPYYRIKDNSPLFYKTNSFMVVSYWKNRQVYVKIILQETYNFIWKNKLICRRLYSEMEQLGIRNNFYGKISRRSHKRHRRCGLEERILRLNIKNNSCIADNFTYYRTTPEDKEFFYSNYHSISCLSGSLYELKFCSAVLKRIQPSKKIRQIPEDQFLPSIHGTLEYSVNRNTNTCFDRETMLQMYVPIAERFDEIIRTKHN